MSDANDYEFEDEPQDQQATKDPVRARMREMEKQIKAYEAKAKEAEVAQRELAFVKAGVDLNNPAAKYFLKGYDGELTPESIREAAVEASLIPGSSAQMPAEQQAWKRVANAAQAGATSEPPVDYAQRIAQAKNTDEVMQLLAQARAEAESI